ncbi:hypothetical protein [Opitutus terrae]|uniref:hypothetical protein n=1 Tax=Opitutus terrae TaxID=107709 RepID=UPI0011D103E3|nr:hypothetical protein [Opitutus terrae]
MADDPLAEIEALKTVFTALDPLDSPARQRVLRWIAAKFGNEIADSCDRDRGSSRVEQPLAKAATEAAGRDLPTLFASAQPTTEQEKALVVGYWVQVDNGEPDFDSQTVNGHLKHLGHGVGNITRCFESLIASRPQLVIQTRKSGTTQQARKQYRVTAEGVARVNQMLAAARTQEAGE